MKIEVEQEIINLKSLIEDREEEAFERTKAKLARKSHYILKSVQVNNCGVYVNGRQR